MNNFKTIGYNTLVGVTLFSLMLTSGAALSQDNDEENEEIEEIIEEIVVYGIRSSIESARAVKREADTVVEAITPVEIGQFVDDSIAGAMQRVAGVQVETDPAGTDGDRVAIRGLGSQFVNSSINGRTLLSSGNAGQSLRKMNFNVFPANILSGVRIAKGSTAARPESGMAGQVDLQTIRPLDLRELDKRSSYGSLTARAEQGDLYDDDGVRYEGLFAWRNDERTLGIFLGGTTGDADSSIDQIIQQARAQRNIRVDTNGNGVWGGRGSDEELVGVTVPNASTHFSIKQQTKRNAFSGGLHFRPNDGPEIILDITYAEFDNKSNRDTGQILTAAAWAGAAPLFPVDQIEVDDANFLQYADFRGVGGNRFLLSRIQDQTFNNTTENLITGLNIDWNIGALSTNLDVYYSGVEYFQDLRFPIFNQNLFIGASTLRALVAPNCADPLSDVVYDARGTVPTWDIGPEVNDPSCYHYLFSVVREIDLEGDNYGTTLNFDLELDGNVFSSLTFGAHYEKTDIESTKSIAERFIANASAGYRNALNYEFADAAISGVLTDPMQEGVFQPVQWLQSDFSVVAELDPRVLTRGFDNLPVDVTASHQSVEEILALFVQGKIDDEMGGKPLSGNVGVRAVLTDHSSNAFAVVDGGEPIPVETGGNYWEFLPSVNLNWALASETALRFGLARTMSRAPYEDLAPIITANTPIPTPENPDPVGFASAGNPELEPITAWNVDLTLEWYNQSGGSVTGSIFYKDVSGFIIDSLTLSTTVPGQDPNLSFDVRQPVNFSDGEVKGYEIAVYQPIDELIPALAGFGISANYTYVDSSFDKDVGNSGFGFPGASEDNYNVTAYYENRWVSARLAYVTRGEFFRELASQGTQSLDARFTGKTETLDLNVAFRGIPNTVVSFNARNLTDDARRDHLGRDDHFLAYYDVGRSYALTLIYRL